MKILDKDLKSGTVKLFVETAEDIWCISQVIEVGDIVQGRTLRKMKVTETADAQKKAVFLSLKTEQVEFKGVLRVSGKIIDGSEDVPKGSYHTFTVDEGTAISIIKERWFEYQLKRIDEAAQGKKSKVLIVVFDREDAYFAILKQNGTEDLSHIKGEVEKKRLAVNIKSSFYDAIISQIKEYDSRFGLDIIILASPAFWKEDLLKVLKDADIRKKIIQASCSSADERAIDEVIKRDEVKSALSKERTLKEITLVDEVLSAIARKGRVAYGISQVNLAVGSGAIDILLITDTLIQKTREKGTFAEIENILRETENQNGTVIIISGGNTGGKRLDGLGGIAALLRYKLNEL